MKLYIVTLQNYNDYYVIAKDAQEAYDRVKDLLDENDWGFTRERELKSVEILGEGFFNSRRVFKSVDD